MFKYLMMILDALDYNIIDVSKIKLSNLNNISSFNLNNPTAGFWKINKGLILEMETTTPKPEIVKELKVKMYKPKTNKVSHVGWLYDVIHTEKSFQNKLKLYTNITTQKFHRGSLVEPLNLFKKDLTSLNENIHLASYKSEVFKNMNLPGLASTDLYVSTQSIILTNETSLEPIFVNSKNLTNQTDIISEGLKEILREVQKICELANQNEKNLKLLEIKTELERLLKMDLEVLREQLNNKSWDELTKHFNGLDKHAFLTKNKK